MENSKNFLAEFFFNCEFPKNLVERPEFFAICLKISKSPKFPKNFFSLFLKFRIFFTFLKISESHFIELKNEIYSLIDEIKTFLPDFRNSENTLKSDFRNSETKMDNFRNSENADFRNSENNDFRNSVTILDRIEFHLEAMYAKLFFFDDFGAESELKFALDLANLKPEFTGILGRRTRFQQFDVTQLVLQVASGVFF